MLCIMAEGYFASLYWRTILSVYVSDKNEKRDEKVRFLDDLTITTKKV